MRKQGLEVLRDEILHLEVVDKILRLAKKVRIFPLVTLKNERSPHVEMVITQPI